MITKDKGGITMNKKKLTAIIGALTAITLTGCESPFDPSQEEMITVYGPAYESRKDESTSKENKTDPETGFSPGGEEVICDYGIPSDNDETWYKKFFGNDDSEYNKDIPDVYGPAPDFTDDTKYDTGYDGDETIHTEYGVMIDEETDDSDNTSDESTRSEAEHNDRLGDSGMVDGNNHIMYGPYLGE